MDTVWWIRLKVRSHRLTLVARWFTCIVTNRDEQVNKIKILARLRKKNKSYIQEPYLSQHLETFDRYSKNKKEKSIGPEKRRPFEDLSRSRKWTGSRVICLGSLARKRGRARKKEEGKGRRNGAEGRRKEERRRNSSCNTRYVSCRVRGVVGACAPGRVTRRDYYHLYRPLRAASWTVGSARARGTRAASPTTRARPIPPVPRSRIHAPARVSRILPAWPQTRARKTGTLWAWNECGTLHFIYIYIKRTGSMSSLSAYLSRDTAFSDILIRRWANERRRSRMGKWAKMKKEKYR